MTWDCSGAPPVGAPTLVEAAILHSSRLGKDARPMQASREAFAAPTCQDKRPERVCGRMGIPHQLRSPVNATAFPAGNRGQSPRARPPDTRLLLWFGEQTGAYSRRFGAGNGVQAIPFGVV